jgi:hypothetical protein
MRNVKTKKSMIFFILATILSCVPNVVKASDYIDTLIQNERIVSKDITHKIIKFDLSNLWTTTRNDCVYGYIGKNYQRLRIKFISVQRDSIDSTVYNVQGKSNVKANICSFQGFITINKAFYIENIYSPGEKTGILVGKYKLQENADSQHSGIFTGNYITYWYIDRQNKIHYNDLGRKGADGYCNNQFVGIWTRYSDNIILECRWGDYRIPGLTEAVDCGAAEFSINEKYRDYGWNDFLKAQQESYNNKIGIYTRKEREEWWK